MRLVALILAVCVTALANGQTLREVSSGVYAVGSASPRPSVTKIQSGAAATQTSPEAGTGTGIGISDTSHSPAPIEDGSQITAKASLPFRRMVFPSGSTALALMASRIHGVGSISKMASIKCGSGWK